MLDQSLQEIQATINQLYDSICFRAGEKPDLGRLKRLFIPDGKLINNNPDEPMVMTVDQFIEIFEAQISRGAVLEFHEHEIAHRTLVFGKIAQRFSTFETKVDYSDSQPFTMGINSIQLIKTGTDWFITSLTWNDQNDSLRIPEQYL